MDAKRKDTCGFYAPSSLTKLLQRSDRELTFGTTDVHSLLRAHLLGTRRRNAATRPLRSGSCYSRRRSLCNGSTRQEHSNNHQHSRLLRSWLRAQISACYPDVWHLVPHNLHCRAGADACAVHFSHSACTEPFHHLICSQLCS